MAGSRAPMRYASVALALLRWGGRRQRPPAPRRILVLHHLLLGDTLMVTALLAKLRARYPDAQIAMTVARPIAPLYATQPYGVTAHVLDPRDFATFRALAALPRFDLAILPADNRWSWLARAIGARWIVGIAGDRPAHKNWPVDELVPYSPAPASFAETAADLVRGRAARAVSAGRLAPRRRRTACRATAGATRCCTWARVRRSNCGRPSAGASLADHLEARGLAVVLSAGPGETAILDAIDPDVGAPAHRRHAVAAAAAARAGGCAAARVPGHRHRASRPHRRRADGHAVRPRVGGDLRPGSVLRGRCRAGR